MARQVFGLAAHDQRLAHAGALPCHGGAQHARIVALGKDHPGLGLPRAAK
jgi:hypothetical protein